MLPRGRNYLLKETGNVIHCDSESISEPSTYPFLSFFFLRIFPLLEFVYLLFLSVLGLHSCMGFSLVVVNGGHSLIAMRRLLIVVTSLVAERGL